jgi:hypothetical protein
MSEEEDRERPAGDVVLRGNTMYVLAAGSPMDPAVRAKAMAAMIADRENPKPEEPRMSDREAECHLRALRRVMKRHGKPLPAGSYEPRSMIRGLRGVLAAHEAEVDAEIAEELARMKRARQVRAGEVVLVSGGEYSNYTVACVGVATRDLDIDELIERFRAAHPKLKDGYRGGQYVFANWLANVERAVEEPRCHEVHIGGYDGIEGDVTVKDGAAEELREHIWLIDEDDD